MINSETLDLPGFLPEAQLRAGVWLILEWLVTLEVAHRIFKFLVFRREDRRLQKASTSYGNGKHDNNVHTGNGSNVDDQDGGKCPNKPVPVPKDALAKTAAQYAHFVANFYLACAGIYFWFFSGLPPHSETIVDDRLTGFVDHTIFGCVLIAYNIWSTYISYTVWGQEELIMTLHHACASAVGFVSGFRTFGARYYAPFFYGLAELSSLPLSIMNIFKYRQDWKMNMPVYQNTLKGIFALTFLTVRVGFWLPMMSYFFSDVRQIFLTDHPGLTWQFSSVIILAASLPAFVLTCLQVYWGYRIVLMIRYIFVRKNDIKKKT